MDVDNFRQINELYSRKLGDRILCTIAYNIQVLLPDNARLFRLDNDRLGFLMRDAGKKEVNQFFSRIQKRFSALQEWKKEKLEIHLSAGCAFFLIAARRQMNCICMQTMPYSMQKNREKTEWSYSQKRS